MGRRRRRRSRRESKGGGRERWRERGREGGKDGGRGLVESGRSKGKRVNVQVRCKVSLTADTIVRVATLRQKLQIRLPVSPSHSPLPSGRPV